MSENNFDNSKVTISQNDQLRIVEALLFASSDPLDKKTSVSYTHLTLPTKA